MLVVMILIKDQQVCEVLDPSVYQYALPRTLKCMGLIFITVNSIGK